MSSYVASLVALGLCVIFAFYQQQQRTHECAAKQSTVHQRHEAIDEELHNVHQSSATERFMVLRNQFLIVYVFATAADWLQGSFMYSLYKNTHQVPEATIAALFAAGFLCAGKKACQAYCVAYVLSNLTMLSGNIWILMLGRALGGVSTTILFTAFETWMVSEFHRQDLTHTLCSLSSLYGTMSAVNGFIAVGSGVVAQILVAIFASEKAPFMASIVCLVVACYFISTLWVENHRSRTDYSIREATTAPRAGVSELLQPDLLLIGYATCLLEGSMYVMVYSWPEAISTARPWESANVDPPFGIIFACFMSALTLGSMFFDYSTRDGNSRQLSTSFVQLALSLSALCFVVVVASRRQSVRFIAFCVFEFCVGLYFPSIAYLRGHFVKDAHRATTYGLIRVPLNVFVFVSLISIHEGDISRENRFLLCSGLLLVGTYLLARRRSAS
ncbi:uncharacterized protein N7506_000091 [Penicillium brevicompactum]|uniref:uncharacterized protein n=1 Tax=Penicillium brevicompactum TaxID=5074 RepID=UPI0025401895|nr:uncharacterized protein N7506_000091 [Penicillium brevicompactum]KAJ5346838.1 hypothetical protein N7506_000091 [Penicillium brevicompactum]